MKAEINNENKEKFFTQYWDQKIIFDRICIGRDLEYVSESLGFSAGIFNYLQLLLKPLSSISDEDAWFLVNLEGNSHQMHWDNDQFLKRGKKLAFWIDFELKEGDHNGVFNTEKFIWAIDYLRSKGYALPWMGLSVQEMVESGWIKLV